jgi:hypothetical protein
MKISSPVGDYDYSVRAIRLEGGRVVVDGNLGVWETTMVIEPSDWARLAKRAALPTAMVALAVASRRRLRR